MVCDVKGTDSLVQQMGALSSYPGDSVAGEVQGFMDASAVSVGVVPSPEPWVYAAFPGAGAEAPHGPEQAFPLLRLLAGNLTLRSGLGQEDLE